MPIYVFTCKCENSIEYYKSTPYKRKERKRCNKCGLYMHRDYNAEHSNKRKDLHLDYNNDPISHLSKKRSFKGIMIENLTPEPVFVRSERQYQRLLKSTNSREKEA